MSIPPLQTLTKIGTEEQAPRGESRTGRAGRASAAPRFGRTLQRLTPEQGSIRADTGRAPKSVSITLAGQRYLSATAGLDHRFKH